MRNVAVVGLGYVGLPVAVAFGNNQKVTGFDISQERINELNEGIDRTREFNSSELSNADIQYTTEENLLKNTDFIIVSVPTPINENNQPNLTPLKEATKKIGENLTKGSIVVYESTVYPGATEEECIPLLEKFSKLKNGVDFFVGYSPERINPGDKQHTFSSIKKVVSAQNEEALKVISEMYKSVIDAEIFEASSIKVAEAAKVIENTQRDINIAFMNELAIIFNKLNINTNEVLKAAGTKWNFLNFSPGLVGGHCIGVDPYYLTHKAQKVGHHPEVILAGRKINDNVGNFIASSLIKELIKNGKQIQGSKVTVLGFTFKENVPDIRNTRVIDIINELKDFDIDVQVSDAYASNIDSLKEYNLELVNYENLKPADAVILAVPHQEYLGDSWNKIKKLLIESKGTVVDIKSKLNTDEIPEGINVWRL